MTTTMRGGKRQRVRKALLKYQGLVCAYCTRRMVNTGECQPEAATIDHIVPQSRGGNHEMVNLVLVCFKCNHAKGDMTLQEYELTDVYRAYRTCAERRN